MKATISLIKGDGISIDVSEAAIFLAKKAIAKAGIPTPKTVKIAAGAAMALDAAIETGFSLNQLRPMKFGGNMGTKATTLTLSSLMDGKLK